MANINKIRLSGTTYNIQDPNAQPLLTAGRGIDITNDTISVSLPISAGTGTDSIIEGASTIASGDYSHAEGRDTIASGDYSHAEGRYSQANGSYSHAEGYRIIATGTYSHAEGVYTITNNQSEHVSGQFNVSSKASSLFGESGNTLFSVGNGESDSSRHNAFEIRQNGDIYITSGGTDIKLQDNLGGSSITTVELTQAQYDALVSGGTVDPNTFYIITDATGGDLSNYYTKSETSGATEISTALASKADTATTYTKTEVDNAITAATSTKQNTLVSGTNIKTINNESILGSGNITIQGGSDINVVQTTGTSTTDVMSQNAVTTQLGGYVTTDTEQTISGKKIFTYSSSSAKAIEFKQTSDSAKVGFRVLNSASTNNELATLEFRPNTFTIDSVQHPLLYFGHYRNNNTANAGVPQTVIGFRQYDQKNAAAYHYLMPLPEKAKTPFSLTTSFKDYYAPMGFKNGSTMITADNTGVVDLSSELGGLKLVKLTQAEYDALATKDDNTVYFIGDSTNGYTMKIGSANVN